jgi:ATP dependent DNA ligase C terminal region
VGTGTPVKVLADLRRRLDPLTRKTSPLSVPPPPSTRFGSPLLLSRVHWVDPKLVAEITYLTWTADKAHTLCRAARGQARDGRSTGSRVRSIALRCRHGNPSLWADSGPSAIRAAMVRIRKIAVHCRLRGKRVKSTVIAQRPCTPRKWALVKGSMSSFACSTISARARPKVAIAAIFSGYQDAELTGSNRDPDCEGVQVPAKRHPNRVACS